MGFSRAEALTNRPTPSPQHAARRQYAATEARGLPVPRVWSVQEIGGRWGLVFDRVEQSSFAERMASNSDEIPRYVECMVRLHMAVHAHRVLEFADVW